MHYNLWKKDEFSFPIDKFPFLDEAMHLDLSNGVYISQLVRLSRFSTNVSDFYGRNLHLTGKGLQQGYRFHKRPRLKVL